jgi:hypothetical protein
MVHHRELIFGDTEGDRARAHWWSDDLVSGRSVSMDVIGKQEGVGKRHVSRMICLAFLAHDHPEHRRGPPEPAAQFFVDRLRQSFR